MSPDATARGRIKVLMVIDSYDDSKNGATISTRRFVNLLQQDCDVSILSTGIAAPGKIVLPRFYAPGVKQIMKKMQAPLAIPSRRILRKAIRDVHIVHIQFPFLLGIEAVRMARKLKVPVVSTFHIQAEHLAMNAGIHSPMFIRYCYKIWLKTIYNRSRMVICPSHFAEEELQRYGLKSPTALISNGILPIFHPICAERPEAFKEKFIILSVGRLAPEKRHEVIIRAINGSPYREKIILFLIGEGPAKERLQHLGEELPNPPVFLFLKPEELVYYYNIADLYIHAATIEVECMTVLEAMGCGLPVVIAHSPKSATCQFAIDDRFLFEGDDIKALTSRINYWVEHPSELDDAKKPYLEKSSHYRIEMSVEKLLSIYRNLVPPGSTTSTTDPFPPGK